MIETRVRWVEGGQFIGETVASGHALVVDSGPDYGGRNTGPRPTELLLLALGSCTGTAVAEILRKKRQPFTGLEVIVRGKQAEEWPREYTDIVVEYVVRGQGVTRKAVERAIHLSETRYCPVMNSLKARISSSFRIVEE